MDSRDHVARRGAQARWARFLQEEVEVRACMQIAGGWMECRGSAGAGEGQVHAGTLPALVSGCALGALSTGQCAVWTGAHWVKQISLDLPRASDPVWVAARQEQCTSIMALPVSNSQPGLQRNQDGVVREVAKGTNHWSGAQGVQMGVWPVFLRLA